MLKKRFMRYQLQLHMLHNCWNSAKHNDVETMLKKYQNKGVAFLVISVTNLHCRKYDDVA